MYSEFSYKNKIFSLVLVRIFTGRTHQVRVSMKSLGTPIVSDDRYSVKSEIQKELIKRMFLHNIYLSFEDNNKRYNIDIPLPTDIQNCLKKMKLIKRYKYNFNDIINLKPKLI